MIAQTQGTYGKTLDIIPSWSSTTIISLIMPSPSTATYKFPPPPPPVLFIPNKKVKLTPTPTDQAKCMHPCSLFPILGDNGKGQLGGTGGKDQQREQ
jgi:hypothetical protein